jgi:hypothetical protein
VALPRLPAGSGLTLAFRRATRARASEGRPIEDVGVPGHVRYAMTRRDVLGGNRDLLAAAADVLAAQRHTRLSVRAGRGALRVRARGLDRLRVTIDDVDTTTVALTGTAAEVALPEGWQAAEIEGIGAGQVLQRRRVRAGSRAR